MNKSVYTGTPVRDALLRGSVSAGRTLAGIAPGDSERRILLVVGGSLGADRINTVVRESLANLSPLFHVVHVCGPGKSISSMQDLEHYSQFEFVNEGWGDLLAAADIVLSRAGANAIYELLTLQKPSLLVPLSLKASRGDQIVNAALMQKQGFSQVLAEDELSSSSLEQTLVKMLAGVKEMQIALNTFHPPDALQLIVAVLKKYMR
jgi:UDP-N-acetylglucosamine--N-acetylmuramyl-(pentapeptide) pyrophosphoryl-undecaprenol N-acetylglucosamine transferase